MSGLTGQHVVAVAGAFVLGVNLVLVALALTALWSGVPWRSLVPLARRAVRVLVELRLPASARTTQPMRLPEVTR